MAALLRPTCASGLSLCVLLADGWWKSSPAPNVTNLLFVFREGSHPNYKALLGISSLSKRKPFSVNYFITCSTLDFMLLTAPWLDKGSRAADISAFDAFQNLISWTLLQMAEKLLLYFLNDLIKTSIILYFVCNYTHTCSCISKKVRGRVIVSCVLWCQNVPSSGNFEGVKRNKTVLEIIRQLGGWYMCESWMVEHDEACGFGLRWESKADTSIEKMKSSTEIQNKESNRTSG